MFTIKCVDHDGNEMFMRQGARIGEGPVVRYATRAAAERDAAMLRENVGDEFQCISVVVLRKGMA